MKVRYITDPTIEIAQAACSFEDKPSGVLGHETRVTCKLQIN